MFGVWFCFCLGWFLLFIIIIIICLGFFVTFRFVSEKAFDLKQKGLLLASENGLVIVQGNNQQYFSCDQDLLPDIHPKCINSSIIICAHD